MGGLNEIGGARYLELCKFYLIRVIILLVVVREAGMDQGLRKELSGAFPV